MADESLIDPIVVQAFGIMASSLPPGFSPVYQKYVLSQVQDLSAIAGKANDAGQGAYDAQVENEQQNLTLANHELRIVSTEEMLTDHEHRLIQIRVEVDDHEVRIAANTNAIILLDGRLTAAEGKIVTLQSDVEYLIDEVVHISGDYVSKSVTTSQSLRSPLNVATSYSIGGVKVVGERVTGFTPATGSALKGVFDASQEFPVSDPPTQAEVQAIANGLIANRRRTKALEDALRAHGLIN